MNPIIMRLQSQHLVAPLFSDPSEVVEYMGAMQAQEYRMMRWAVAMRTKAPSAESFRRAYNGGRIIRLHLLRGTWQLVSCEDYGWMLRLCASKSISVIRGWMKANKIEISDEEYSFVRKILERVAGDKGSVTKEDFVSALSDKNMKMDDHRLSYHVRMAELNGILCSGDLHPTKATYALAESKIKNVSFFDREEALALLARKYFQSRSPATLTDFVWWSGLNVGECRKAICALGSELMCECAGGLEFYLHESCGMRESGGNSEFILLAPYDEYLIGYKSREVVLPAEYRSFAHSNNGIFYPVVLLNGVVCGNWKPFLKDLQADFFVPNDKRNALEEVWNLYEKFRNG